ncbi:MAG: septum formation initiator family protein [Bacteroidia bacterium]
MLKKTISVVRNKYFIVFFGLVLWLLFFDKNDILSQVQMSHKITQLKEEKQYYIREIAKNKTDMEELKTNPKNLEKFAREKYLMKKDNEDIFVIVNTNKVSADSPDSLK